MNKRWKMNKPKRFHLVSFSFWIFSTKLISIIRALIGWLLKSHVFHLFRSDHVTVVEIFEQFHDGILGFPIRLQRENDGLSRQIPKSLNSIQFKIMVLNLQNLLNSCEPRCNLACSRLLNEFSRFRWDSQLNIDIILWPRRRARDGSAEPPVRVGTDWPPPYRPQSNIPKSISSYWISSIFRHEIANGYLEEKTHGTDEGSDWTESSADAPHVIQPRHAMFHGKQNIRTR